MLLRGATLAARWLRELQPISNQPVGLGFTHRAVRNRPGGSPFSSPGWYGRIYDPEMEPYLPLVRQDLDIVARGNYRRTPALRAPANQQPAAGVKFPHCAGRYRPGGSPPGCRVCRFTEGFLNRGWGLSSSGCTGFVYEHQPISDQHMGLGFPPRARRFRPGRPQVSSPGYRTCQVME